MEIFEIGLFRRQLLHFLHPNSPIIHLAAIAFKTNRPARWNRQRIRQHFTVTGAIRHVIRDDDIDFIPILRFVAREIRIRPGDEIIATLQLRPANKNSAIGIRARAKFQFQIKVIRKLALRPDFLDQPWSMCMHRQHTIRRGEAPIITCNFSVEADERVRAITPTGKIGSIEQRNKTGFRFEVIGVYFRQGGPQNKTSRDREGKNGFHGL